MSDDELELHPSFEIQMGDPRELFELCREHALIVRATQDLVARWKTWFATPLSPLSAEPHVPD